MKTVPAKGGRERFKSATMPGFYSILHSRGCSAEGAESDASARALPACMNALQRPHQPARRSVTSSLIHINNVKEAKKVMDSSET